MAQRPATAYTVAQQPMQQPAMRYNQNLQPAVQSPSYQQNYQPNVQPAAEYQQFAPAQAPAPMPEAQPQQMTLGGMQNDQDEFNDPMRG